MNAPITPAVRAEIQRLEERLAAIRKAHGISAKNEHIWHAEDEGDRFLLVIADGFGAAKLIRGDGRIEGDQYCVLNERAFSSEDEACEVARELNDGEIEVEEAFPG